METTERTAAAGERNPVEPVVGTLDMHCQGETLGELAHDARNMMTALSLYCDLLEEPGVLAPLHRHYGRELRLLSDASRHLVEKLMILDRATGESTTSMPVASSRQGRQSSGTQGYPVAAGNIEPLSGGLIDDLREEVLASRDLLAAIAGPSISVIANAEGGNRPVRMSGENLIRALVNLVKNSAESIDGCGTVHLSLVERRDESGAVRAVLTIEDTGCGIAPDLLDKAFEPGFSTRNGKGSGRGNASGHRGLGLHITRSIVEAAGGCIRAENGTAHGARFVIELPVRIS